MKEKQTKQQTLQAVAENILQLPVKIAVKKKATGGIAAFLHKCRLLSDEKVFLIHPITLGNMIRISRLLLQVDPEAYNQEKLIDSNYKIIEQYGETIATVIATAIHNQREEPPRSLVRFIMYHFTAWDLMRVLVIVVQQMDLSNFMHTIISIRNMNIIESKEMSPETQGS
jgi:hypothetical protein